MTLPRKPRQTRGRPFAFEIAFVLYASVDSTERSRAQRRYATETIAIANLPKTAGLMRNVKELGSHFSLDDFGTSMSSFAYLKYLPVGYLKIDGAFVRDVLSDRIDHEIVDAIIRVCRALGIRTIAEFVEDESTKSRLRTLGVDYAQGYAIGKPVPLK